MWGHSCVQLWAPQHGNGPILSSKPPRFRRDFVCLLSEHSFLENCHSSFWANPENREWSLGKWKQSHGFGFPPCVCLVNGLGLPELSPIFVSPLPLGRPHPSLEERASFKSSDVPSAASVLTVVWLCYSAAQKIKTQVQKCWEEMGSAAPCQCWYHSSGFALSQNKTECYHRRRQLALVPWPPGALTCIFNSLAMLLAQNQWSRD